MHVDTQLQSGSHRREEDSWFKFTRRAIILSVTLRSRVIPIPACQKYHHSSVITNLQLIKLIWLSSVGDLFRSKIPHAMIMSPAAPTIIVQCKKAWAKLNRFWSVCGCCIEIATL